MRTKMSSELGNKSIIAMKGHPFTRKTHFATKIAGELRCPVFALHDFLIPDCFQTSASTDTIALQDLAFQIICHLTKYNLSDGFVTEIVINSPLISRSHLDQLIELASSLEDTRLVIIECKTNSFYEWQAKFEEDCHLQTHIWYNAKSWEDVEKAFRDDYDERLDGYKVSKLVLDPFSDYLNHALDRVLDAVRYMIRRNECDGPDLVVYDQWRHGQYLIPSFTSGDNEEEYDGAGLGGTIEERKKLGSCRGGSAHCITNYAEDGLEYEAKCIACENQVMGMAAYTCKLCRFALHKECAELPDDNKPLKGLPPDFLNSLLVLGYRKVFPKINYCCSSCKETNTHSDSCGDCLFTTHLKTRVLPTVVRHDCDEHFLTISLSDPHSNSEEFLLCKACGDPFFSIWYSCNMCCVSYHYKCLTEVPVQVEHEHGAHHHHMVLHYTNKEAEDYLCDVCFEREDPERRDRRRWFYSCKECQYVAHLDCVYDGMTYSDPGMTWKHNVHL